MTRRPMMQLEAPPLRRRLVWAKRWRGLIARTLDPLAVAAHNDQAIIRRELLPLLGAIRWHEREASRLLTPRSARGRPVWLAGVQTKTTAEPLGRVLIVARSDSPLLPMGVDLLRSVVAGNRVVVDLDPRWARSQGLLVELARAAWEATTGESDWIRTHGPTPDELAALRVTPTPAMVIGHADRRAVSSIAGWAHSESVLCDVHEPRESIAIVCDGARVETAARSVIGALAQGLVGDWVRPRRVYVDRRVAAEFERAIRPIVSGLRPKRVRAAIAEEAHALARLALGHHARSASGIVESPSTKPAAFRPLVLLDAPPMLELPSEPVPIAMVSVYDDLEEVSSWISREPSELPLSVFGAARSARDVINRIAAQRSVTIGHWASELVHPGLDAESRLRALTQECSRVRGGGLGEIGGGDQPGWIARLYRHGVGGATPDLEIRPEPTRHQDSMSRARSSAGRAARRKGGRQRQS